MSKQTDDILKEAHWALADFLHVSSLDEIIFRANMTSLTFSVSQALGSWLRPGDEIVITRLDHDANIRPWVATGGGLRGYGAIAGF
ncbi:MAG: Cysteine desulfurase [Verrucomicrobia subdivision 3 bacterium]|nr:Cysteine desulfurase [Limisphaerales bacterium]MCS1414346.1 Cysteine desulfurase [Limisphaerales bacterium]